MPKYNIRQYAHQHRRHQWFRRIIEEQIWIHLFKYLTTDKIGQQTRWQNYDSVTAALQPVTRVKREEDPVHINAAQLFNIMQKYAGVIDPDFLNWIQLRALAVYYSHNSNLKFLNDNRARIEQLCTYYPILSHNLVQIEKAAKNLMSRKILIQRAEQYLKDSSYRRRTDESITNMVWQYLLTDIRDGISRWTFYAAITQAIEKEQYVIGTTRMTTVTTSTTTTTTTKRTTTTGRSMMTVTTTTTARTVGITYPPIPPTPAIHPDQKNPSEPTGSNLNWSRNYSSCKCSIIFNFRRSPTFMGWTSFRHSLWPEDRRTRRFTNIEISWPSYGRCHNQPEPDSQHCQQHQQADGHNRECS